MKKIILLSIVLLTLMVAPLSDVFAQARYITYQGNLLDAQDKPLNGPVQMTFELYSEQFGGQQLWSEIQSVKLLNGYFNVYLGTQTPFPLNFNFNQTLWLQVTVGTSSPYERTLFSMVPYSGYSDKSAIAGFAEDIADGSVTLAKLADEVKIAGGDLEGFYPNPTIKGSAIVKNIPDGSITQSKLDPNVTTLPAGPASGDLTGFYPDPLIAKGAVKTDRLYDGAVVNEKIADATIKYEKFQNAAGSAGTILSWNGSAWVENTVPTLEEGRQKEVLGFDGNYEVTTTDANGFLHTSVGIATDGVTTAKIKDGNVTYAKFQPAVGPAETILAWNGTAWAETTVPALEADAVIGNEVLNATPGRGLVRAGAGTEASPFTLGIADDGIQTSMIQNQAITLSKLANGTVNSQVMYWNNLTQKWQLSGGPMPTDNQVLRFVNDGAGTSEPVWSNDDAIVGNEITDVIPAAGLQRLGAGTTASPYTVGVAPLGITSDMLAWHSVTYDKLQDATAAAPAGTILSWNGTNWIENLVSNLEADGVIGNEVLDATAGEGLVRAGAGTAADPYTLGIAANGVTSTKIADGAVSLSKLSAGTQIGQVMWWDQSANQWRLSTGAAPVQDYVVKWVDAGGSLTPQWAKDDMTIPYAKTITENTETLFAITNNGNSDVANFTTTGKGNGLEVNVPNDLVGGGHAIHANGGGLNQPALLVDRTSEYGLPTGAATINATVNTLDAATAGLQVNTTINDDGNNNYNVESVRGLLTVNNGVANADYKGVYGNVSANTGHASAVWGSANGANTQVNSGVVGEANNGGENFGVLGVANADADAFISAMTGTGMSAANAAYNTGGTFNDYGVFSLVDGDGTGVYAEAVDGSAVVATNYSSTEASLVAANYNDGAAFIASSYGTADNYTGVIANNSGNGRGLAINGGAANDKNGGLPYFNDPTDNDDAALVVYNPHAASLGGGAAFATAIKTYGDIWANSAIGASQIIGLDSVVVGNPITGPYIAIYPPSSPGAPLVINGDVLINGDVEAEDGNFNGNVNVAGTATVDALDVTNNAHVHGDLTVDGTFTAGATVLSSLTVFPGSTELEDLQVNQNANFAADLSVIGNTSLTGDLAVAGNTDLKNTNVDGDLGVTGTTTTNILDVTTNANIGADLTVLGVSYLKNTNVDGDFDVTGNSTLKNTLVDGDLHVTGNTQLDGTLNVDGAATFTDVATFSGTDVNISNATKLNVGNELNTYGTSGISDDNFLVSQGVGLAPKWTNTINNINVNHTITTQFLDVTADAHVGGDFEVDGLTTLNGNTTINAELDVTGNATFGADVDVAGTLYTEDIVANGDVDLLLGNLTVHTGTTSLQNTNVTGTFDVTGPTNLDGTLNVTGNSTLKNTLVDGDLHVTGNTQLDGTLNVDGAATFTDIATFSGSDVTTSNATKLNVGFELNTYGTPGTLDDNFLVSQGVGLAPKWTNSINNINVNNTTTTQFLDVTADAHVGGDFEVDGLTTLNGNTTINAELDVTGNATFGADVDVAGTLYTEDIVANGDVDLLLGDLTVHTGTTSLQNTNVTGTFDVTGASTLDGTLHVTGATTLDDNLIVKGTTDLQGNVFNSIGDLNIVDNTIITGNLTVTGGPGQGLITGKDLLIQQNATVNQNLTVNQNATFNQNATVNQNLTVGGHTSVKTLDVAGDIKNPTLGDPVWVNDDLDVNGDVDIHGNLTVTGTITVFDLNVIHDLTVGNDASVANNFAVGNNATVAGTLGVTGDGSFGNDVDINNNLEVGNNLKVIGNADVDNDLWVGNDAEVVGNTTLGGTLDVTGATTLSSTLGVAGNTTVGGTLGVTGATTLSSTLGVTGATTLASTLGVTGATTLSSTLGVTGATTLASTLDVTGVTTLNANLQGTTATFNGAVGVNSLSSTTTVSAGGNVSTGGVFVGALQNALTNGAGIAALNYDNTGAATVSIANDGVTSAMILDGTIVDADVNAAAAIAGTKINPNFGAQNVVTTGSITGASLTASTGNIVASAGALDIQNPLSLSTIAGNLDIGKTVNIGTAPNIITMNDGNIGTEVININQQLQIAFETLTNETNWSEAHLGKRLSFVLWEAGADQTVVTLPDGSYGSILTIRNKSAWTLTFDGHNILTGTTANFIYDGADWILY